MSRASVQALRAELKQRSEKLKANASSAIEYAAQDLAGAIRTRAKVRSGNTAKSVEAVKLPSGGWRVQAGGDLTIKEVRKGSGVTYDYTRAEEFGTVDMKARPFFFNTYRAKKAGIKRRALQKLTEGVVDS
jgi:HK97 gp10 family phage protein